MIWAVYRTTEGTDGEPVAYDVSYVAGVPREASMAEHTLRRKVAGSIKDRTWIVVPLHLAALEVQEAHRGKPRYAYWHEIAEYDEQATRQCNLRLNNTLFFKVVLLSDLEEKSMTRWITDQIVRAMKEKGLL